MSETLSLPAAKLQAGDTTWLRRDEIDVLAHVEFYFEVQEYDDDFVYVEITGHADDDLEAADVDAEDIISDLEEQAPEDFDPYVCDDCGAAFGPDDYDTKKAAAQARAGHGRKHVDDDQEDDAEDAESERSGSNPPGRSDSKGMTASPDDTDDDDEQTGLDELYPDRDDPGDVRDQLEGAAGETP